MNPLGILLIIIGIFAMIVPPIGILLIIAGLAQMGHHHGRRRRAREAARRKREKDHDRMMILAFKSMP